MELHLTATGHHLPPVTWHKWTQTGWYLTYLPQREGRLSSPSWLVTYTRWY